MSDVKKIELFRMREEMSRVIIIFCDRREAMNRCINIPIVKNIHFFFQVSSSRKRGLS